MARKRKRSPKWTLLYRIEDGHKVHLFEPLKKTARREVRT